MFSGFVSVRDLLGYWGKIERGTSTLLGTEEFLVPFGATQILHAEQLADGCFSAEADGLPNAQDLPTFTRHSILIPRKLLAVEVLSTDPFSIHAREIVYFDSGTLLPVYRSIFNQAAELVRFIATSFALVSSEDKKFRRPIVVRQLIWEPAMDRIVTVQVDRHLICPPGASSSSRHILSPRALKVPEQVSEGE